MQLKDTKNVVSRLELVIGVILHLACILIYLIIFGINIQKVWALFASGSHPTFSSPMPIRLEHISLLQCHSLLSR